MSAIFEHIPYYREIFKIREFWNTPFLLIGIPRIDGVYIPKDFNYKDLVELLKARGIKDISTLDLFDQEADLKLDLNKPVPNKYRNRYKVLFDMGTVEHIFDTKKCFENYFSMIKKGGIFVLVTCVNGYFGHGLHVFNPETIKLALRLNGFKIIYMNYTSSTGIKLDNINTKKNVLIWLAAKKVKNVKEFVVPQQELWEGKYKKGQNRENPSLLGKIKFFLRYYKRLIFKLFPQKIATRLYNRF